MLFVSTRILSPVSLAGPLAALAVLAFATPPAEAGGFLKALFSASKAAAPAARSGARAAEDAAIAARGGVRETEKSVGRAAGTAEKESGSTTGEAIKTGVEVAKKGAELANGGSGGSSPGGGHSPASGVMSVGELETCVREAKSLDDLGDSQAASKMSIETQGSEIANRAAEIDAYRQSLNRSSQEEIDSYNGSVEDHNDMIAAHKRSIAAFNASVSAYNDHVRSFNSSCNGKSYYHDDLLAVQQKTGIRLANTGD